TPTNADWDSVAVDSFGYYIVADNSQHQIVRISPTGTVVKVANYPIANSGEAEDVVVRVDSQGNYIVIDDNGAEVGPVQIYRLTPSGTVTHIPLTGTIPVSAGGLTFDAHGNYVIDDYSSQQVVLITL